MTSYRLGRSSVEHIAIDDGLSYPGVTGQFNRVIHEARLGGDLQREINTVLLRFVQDEIVALKRIDELSYLKRTEGAVIPGSLREHIRGLEALSATLQVAQSPKP